MNQPITRGVDHVGLTVKDLPETLAFFTQTLGYKVLGQDPDYPAAFVTDGTTMLTFWQVKDPESARSFDRHKALGLHHLAISVHPDSMEKLHERLKATPGCVIEFAPELSYGGPRRHMMVALPGSGIRVEFKDSAGN